MTAHRSLISIADLTDADLTAIVERGVQFASGHVPRHPPLAATVVGIYFAKTSTRTRTAFSSAALRLGGQIIAFGPHDLQTNTGESISDTGRVLGGMLDLLVARTTGPQREMAEWTAHTSVVNAMSAEEHPTQALCDLTAMRCRFGRIDRLKVLYLGEGNNTAAALALALSRFAGTELDLRTPDGYGVDETILSRARQHAQRCGASVQQRHDLAELPRDVDVIYTTRWQTTGTSKADPRWREAFAPFQVTARLWDANPNAVFMHDLPAHRGEEVTADVLDGPASLAFEQAQHKMHSAMAVLEWCRRT